MVKQSMLVRSLLASSMLVVCSHSVTYANSIEHGLANQQRTPVNQAGNELRLVASEENHKQQAIERGLAALDSGFIASVLNQHNKIQKEFVGGLTKDHVGNQASSVQFKILISDAMGEQALQSLLEAYQGVDNVSFVLQGLLPTERTITDVSRRMMRLAAHFETVPNISLDPRPFRHVKATHVPQLLAYQDDELIAQAIGMTNTRWMQEKLNDDQEGFLGSFGETVAITERDLETVMQERFDALDKEALVQGAKDRFWEKRQYLTLPKANQTQTRTFTPTITVSEDIVTPDGKLIAYQGQRFNTLEQMPFTQRLVVFDATDKAQIEFVKQLPPSHLKTKFIATAFDSSLKWDAVKSVETEIGGSVFQMNRDVLTAFDLRVVPSVVTADNHAKVFVIDEYRVAVAGVVK